MRKNDLQKAYVKDHVPLVKVLGWYGSLTVKPNGKGMMKCLLHNDTHPSLHFDTNKNLWKCYVCDIGGDGITFVMKMENCSYTEALDIICSRHGGPSPDEKAVASPTPKVTPAQSSDDFLSDAFGAQVKKKAPPVPEVTPHLLKAMEDENRSFMSSLYGYQPDCSWLCQAYVDFGVGLAGLTPARGFSMFRGRVVFPLFDDQERLVGFSSRSALTAAACAESGTPKYINSANSALFKKSRLLYALPMAREAIVQDGNVILTEGQKDTIAMHACGFKNTVGLLGSSISAEQIELLKQFTNRVAILMDNDAAGQKAAVRMTEQLRDAGMRTTNLVIPEGDDPDSLCRRVGPDAFRAIINSSSMPQSLNNRRRPLASTGVDNTADSVPVETDLACGDPSDSILECGIYDVNELEEIISDGGNGLERPRLEQKERELQEAINEINSSIHYHNSGVIRVELISLLNESNEKLRRVTKELDRPISFYFCHIGNY